MLLSYCSTFQASTFFRESGAVFRNLIFLLHARIPALVTIFFTPVRFRTNILVTNVSVRFFGKYAPSHPPPTNLEPYDLFF